MADYDLYYWPVPFRGHFVRAILAYAGKTWTEHDADAIDDLMLAPPQEQPVPFKGPPVLIDKASGFALSQMPAIAAYLGVKLALMPKSTELGALTHKVVNDANDVIDEITLDGGRQMWTRKRWGAFLPRLRHWMAIWEATGERHGLRPDSGFLLGTAEAGVADIVTWALWSTLADRFAPIGTLLDEAAPCTARLTGRMQQTPALITLSKRTFKQYGQAYCGGDIEASLREVLGVGP